MKRFNHLLWFFFFSLIFFVSCRHQPEIKLLSGAVFTEGEDNAVFLFLNTDCPICTKYRGQFRNPLYNNQATYFVFPGQQDSNRIKDFVEYDSLSEKQIILDTDYSFSKRLKADITPMVILRRSGKDVYRGMIDDRFKALGVYKPKADINYLQNALNSLHKNEAVQVPYTTAVGCFIESD